VDEEYVEQVLSLVERIPRGRVTTYGLLADVVHRSLGRGGPRQVGAVMATYGGPVPWWRVVRADGSLPDSHGAEARQAYLEEGTPLRTSGAVDLRAAVWLPPESSPQVERPIGGQPGGEPPFPVDGGGWPVDDTPGIGNCHK
jgi:alkylated DNA nucleotide flippase Atl1